MRALISIVIIFLNVCQVLCQDSAGADDVIYFRESDKVKIYSGESGVITGRLNSIRDSLLILKADDSIERAIRIDQIQTVRIKRNSFWLGFAAGAVIGYFGGYGAGYITYHGSEYNEDDSRRFRSIKSGLITAAPSSIAGGLIGAILIRKRFIIQGKKEKILRLNNLL